MRQLLLAPLIALSIAAFAEDVVLEDGRRMTIDREMVVVPNADARVAMFIVHSSVVTDDFRQISGSGDSRNADMLSMMDPELKDYIRRKGIILTTWREMMERRQKYGASLSAR